MHDPLTGIAKHYRFYTNFNINIKITRIDTAMFLNRLSIEHAYTIIIYIYFFVNYVDLRLLSLLVKQSAINLKKRVIITGSLDFMVCSNKFFLLSLVILRSNIVFSISSELRLVSLYLWQTKLRWNSSSISPQLQSLQILSSRGIFWYLPNSICSLCLLIRNFVNILRIVVFRMRNK